VKASRLDYSLSHLGGLQNPSQRLCKRFLIISLRIANLAGYNRDTVSYYPVARVFGG
jgi:hypothetical protein